MKSYRVSELSNTEVDSLMVRPPCTATDCRMQNSCSGYSPEKDGSICKEALLLICAKKAGVTHILKAGGAQAISAMAWGTSSCPKVLIFSSTFISGEIFGLGNQYVKAAKMILQAEHVPDSQVVLLIAGDGIYVEAIEKEISLQCQSLPRVYFAKAVAESFTLSLCLLVIWLRPSPFQILCPEHPIMNVKYAEKWEEFIESTGLIFLGPWTSESTGDYVSGTNLFLPTFGYSRMYSGVSLNSFLKFITVQSLTEEGSKLLGPHVVKMAEVEGLGAQKRAVVSPCMNNLIN
ncbi:hypothetical protein C5167_041313 [Papaver somniferum]|uniref:Uncharacterized protein n=1 Tax=Papaver somniferum TaxID=3469 RepID=A0A4Y7IHI7_PAPSO|nr:hypothetical protein C5167_041313 [Papaver somniferum]